MKRNIKSQHGFTLNRNFYHRSSSWSVDGGGRSTIPELPGTSRYQSGVTDIGAIGAVISDFLLSNKTLPADLAAIGMNGMEDPWGNPYQYVNHETAPPGKRRKDKNLVPINSDYDLYSMGEDGKSVPPLTAKHSRDDIVRANDGKWVGRGEDY